MAPRKRPTLRYICLAALFVVTCGYQIRASYFAFPEFFGHVTVQWPFTASYNGGAPTTAFVTGPAANAGLSDGDVVTAVNGRPFTGLKILGEAVSPAQPGDTMSVDFHPSTSPSETRNATFVLQRYQPPPLFGGLIAIVTLKIVFPFLCIFLGFWVAAVRPYDKSAWLLIFVLFGLCTVYGSGVESWGAGLRDFGVIFRTFMNLCWPLSMLFFGLYFPENFAYTPPQSLRIPIRIVTVGLLACAALAIVNNIGEIENYASVAGLNVRLEKFGPLIFILSIAAASGFFMFTRIKAAASGSPDVKRRFNLIYAGATLGLTPLLILVVIQNVRGGGDLESMFPEWLVIGSFLMLIVFPITLAHVIIVQRAMDVRMVVRQGVQYALARRGTFVLQIVLYGIIILIAGLELQKRHNQLEIVIIVCLGFAAIFWLRSLGDRLRAWIDKRFFRDAYNADQILSGLSDEVRTILETRPLLERVTQRISESLHVPRVAVFTNDAGWFKPAYALGYPSIPEAYFAASGATIRKVSHENDPVRVYLDDNQSWVNSPDVSDDERRNLAAIGSQLLLPLTVKEKVLGVISLGEKKSEAPYSGSDLRLLKSVAAQTGLALANAQLTTAIAEEVGRREKMSREIEIAREVQERLFPQRLQPIAGVEYFGACRTALGVGGDYYDFLALPGGKLGIALGDISGKGIPAALMMASLQASLRAEAARAGADIAGLIARVNQALFDASSEDRYATFFYGQYDPATHELTYVNAGHCAPMLFRAAGGFATADRLDVGGPVIGLIPDCIFEQAVVKVSPGDELVIFTDGVSEAMNRDLEEWGETRLAETVRKSTTLAAPGLIAAIMSAADAFAAGAPQHDDMTLVVARISAS
jgi:sigma-B regulation protein RsbU (phosphoserine phosphatase)